MIVALNVYVYVRDYIAKNGGNTRERNGTHILQVYVHNRALYVFGITGEVIWKFVDNSTIVSRI